LNEWIMVALGCWGARKWSSNTELLTRSDKDAPIFDHHPSFATFSLNEGGYTKSQVVEIALSTDE
jgi:hypothetical protein